MNYELIQKQAGAYVECLPDGQLLSSENAALDLVAACSEYRVNCLLIHSASLPDEFYNLRTRLAGEVLLKFANYRIRVAAVIDPEISTQGRFGEMVLETNRGNQFRVFADRESAEAWLLNS